MKVLENTLLSSLLYYKIGGPAKYLLQVTSKQDVILACDYIKESKITKILPLGIGSNIVISDKGFNGAVLQFLKPEKTQIELVEEGLVKIFSSHLLDDLLQFSFEHGLVGLEWAGGLPSTIGAAVRGNVGAFGGEIKNAVVKVEVIEFNDNSFVEKTLSLTDLQFSYRDSFIKQHKNIIVVNAYFKLQTATDQELEIAKNEYQDHISYRQKNHPMEYPSCGSVFKNIVKKEEIEKIVAVWPDISESLKTKWYGKVSIGYIIDRLGFTGKVSGGAQVSEKHSNYIINKNNATFFDVISLIEDIKGVFNSTFGFYPETEVEIVY